MNRSTLLHRTSRWIHCARNGNKDEGRWFTILLTKECSRQRIRYWSKTRYPNVFLEGAEKICLATLCPQRKMLWNHDIGRSEEQYFYIVCCPLVPLAAVYKWLFEFACHKLEVKLFKYRFQILCKCLNHKSTSSKIMNSRTKKKSYFIFIQKIRNLTVTKLTWPNFMIYKFILAYCHKIL